MKWGIVFASTSFPEPDRAVAMATAAEAAGFESLWCPEHVVVPRGSYDARPTPRNYHGHRPTDHNHQPAEHDDA